WPRTHGAAAPFRRVYPRKPSPSTATPPTCYGRTEPPNAKRRWRRYHDFGLVFAHEDGRPLLINNIGQREYGSLVTPSLTRLCATPVQTPPCRTTNAPEKPKVFEGWCGSGDS